MDVLTPLSDSRQQPVEKMERRISGVSYMYWMDFYNGILCCGILCARLISVSLFRLPRRGLPRPTRPSFPATTPRATTPHASLFSGYQAEGHHAPPKPHGLSRPGLSRLYHHCTAITPVCIYPGYHAIVYFYSWVITPELSRSTTHVNRVITPAIACSS